MGSKNKTSPAVATASTQESIAEILTKHQQGSTKSYDVLVSELASKSVEPSVLVSHLKGLKACVSMLGKEYEVLIGVILKVDWVQADALVVEAYSSFVVNLLSAHTMYLKASLRMIIKQFMPMLQKSSEDETFTIDDATRRKDNQIFLHLHNLLSAILQIVPMTPQVLVPLLSECFPYLGRDAYLQECYMRNLLQVTLYLPKFRCRILEIILDSMMKLDVRSPRHKIQEAEDDDDDEESNSVDQGLMFEMDEVDKNISDSVMSMEKTPSGMSHQDAHKLDIMMEILFNFIKNTCHSDSGELDWETTKKLYKELLYMFDKLILPTHDCCHVQFIMFYIISLREPLVEGFLDYLWKKVQNPNCFAVFRQGAVSYIASLLARAKFISISIVKACMDLMAAWIHQYIRQTANTTSIADIAHHGPFYSVCQAVFYIFAFRHNEILNTPKGYEYIQSLNLQNIVTSRLNPLRFCLPIVARTFANITRMHQLVLCDTIMEKNRRSLLPVDSNKGATVPCTHLNPLDSFFPFDPYLLNRSVKHIQPLYREYEGTPVEDESEESDQDMELTEEEFYAEEDKKLDPDNFVISPSSHGMTPTADFLMYGLSPGFKHT